MSQPIKASAFRKRGSSSIHLEICSSGLVDRLGQDGVQTIMAEAFGGRA